MRFIHTADIHLDSPLTGLSAYDDAPVQQLRTATPDDPMFALSLSTHPPAQQRLDRIEVAMGNQLDGFSGKPPVPLALRLAR